MNYEKKLDQMRKAALQLLSKGDVAGSKKIRLQMLKLIQLQSKGGNYVDDAS
jgi:hypothetical protein